MKDSGYGKEKYHFDGAKKCECGCGLPAPISKRTRRGYMAGSAQRFVIGHRQRLNKHQGAPMQLAKFWPGSTRHPASLVHVHVLTAEKALGKRLPLGAEVHHVNSDRTDASAGNLVICQDHAYHMLLHVRTRVLRAGGNPNTQRICCRCKQLTQIQDLAGDKSRCRPCALATQQLARERRRTNGGLS
jgi:hypothetical protein